MGLRPPFSTGYMYKLPEQCKIWRTGPEREATGGDTKTWTIFQDCWVSAGQGCEVSGGGGPGVPRRCVPGRDVHSAGDMLCCVLARDVSWAGPDIGRGQGVCVKWIGMRLGRCVCRVRRVMGGGRCRAGGEGGVWGEEKGRAVDLKGSH